MAIGKKTGGRTAGTQNKVTKLQREVVQEIVDAQHDKIILELSKLTGKEYLQVVLQLMEFTIPKLQRQEVQVSEQKHPVMPTVPIIQIIESH